MNTATKIDEINNQPTWHFWHLEQEYFIYVGIDDPIEGDGKPRKIYLCIPKQSGVIYIPEYVANMSVNTWQLDEYDTKQEGITALFLPKVNEYLASLGGDGDNDFPINGSDLEQYNWIVENAFEYVNGEVTISNI